MTPAVTRPAAAILERIDARQRLADAQAALMQAIRARDPETINTARRELAAAREHLRDLA